VILSGFVLFLLSMAPFLSFLNVVLNGLKQVKSKRCNACEVWEGKVIISKPKDCAYSIDYKLIWDPCPSKISECWLVVEIPLGIDQLKKERNSFLKKCHPCFFWYCHAYTYFANFDIIIFQSLTFENTKFWQLINPKIWEWCCKHGLNPF
jgi:hypothetical protein